MHTNPFTAAGYDLAELQRKIEQKADQHETNALSGDVARLERTIGELRTEIDELRRRCEVLEESGQEMIREYREANGQFGVGA